MQLLIDHFGAFVGKKDDLFQIRCGEQKHEYAAEKVSQILIQTPSSLSRSAVKLAIDHNIDIVFIDHFGKPFARIYPCTLGGTTLTRKKQLEAYFSEKGLNLIKSFVYGKLKNQLSLLHSLAKTRHLVEFQQKAKDLELFIQKIATLEGTIDTIRDDLLGIQGYVGNQYFSLLTTILPFKKRDHEGKDHVNALLNYGYGILYSEIERACILAGLDPYLGYLHTDRYGKPCLVLDFIEEFRQTIVDRSIITLFVHKQILDEDFEKQGDSFYLSKKGREKLVSAIYEKLNNPFKYRGVKTSLRQVILDQARLVVRYLLEDKIYEPFIYGR